MSNQVKCSNVKPLPARLPNSHALRDFGICPECGRMLVILSSGFFRTHQPRFKAGSPKIEAEIARYKEDANV